MKIDLSGKKAFVCGASRGIGRGIAAQLAECGASVTICSRDEEKLNEVIMTFATGGSQEHSAIPADFSNPHRAIENIKEVLDEGETFHILVNNTGGPAPGEIIKARGGDFYDAVNLHLVMSQLLVQTFVPGMIDAKYGRIINVISVGAREPVANLGVSNTIRGAMRSWAKTLANELGQHGITVNNLLPGQTNTQRLESLIKNEREAKNISENEVKRQMIEKIPVGRLGKVEDLGYAAAFLASEYASFINGASLPIDGGFLKSM